VLEDDRHYFPPYEAVAVVRLQTLQEHPEVSQAIAALGGKISDQEMQKLNYALDAQHQDAKNIAHQFLRSKGLVQ
jgi:glycine betaine/choline ABC-type transport system substrate-binding protein